MGTGRGEQRAEALLESLLEVAAKLGLSVRQERLLREVGYHARSGACRLRESDLVILDRDAPAAERVAVLADVLAQRDLTGVYLSPAVRAFLTRSARAEPGPPAAP